MSTRVEQRLREIARERREAAATPLAAPSTPRNRGDADGATGARGRRTGYREPTPPPRGGRDARRRRPRARRWRRHRRRSLLSRRPPARAAADGRRAGAAMAAAPESSRSAACRTRSTASLARCSSSTSRRRGWRAARGLHAFLVGCASSSRTDSASARTPDGVPARAPRWPRWRHWSDGRRSLVSYNGKSFDVPGARDARTSLTGCVAVSRPLATLTCCTPRAASGAEPEPPP